jgi:hypothetical protein
MAWVKPSLAGLRRRSWPRWTGRTSPARPTSPNTTCFAGSGPVAQAGDHRRGHRKIRARLRDPHAADGVQEHVLVEAGDAGVAVQDREQHRQAVLLEAHAKRLGLPPWASSTSACSSTSSGRVPSCVTMTHEPATARVVLREEERRRVGHLAQPLLRHGEDADLVHRAEAVLERADEAEAGVGLASK